MMTEITKMPESCARSRGISGAGLAATLTRPHMVIILWVGVIIHTAVLLHQLSSRADRSDFSVYYASGLAVREHRDPYTTDFDRVAPGLNLKTDPVHYATDPPTFLLCVEPLTLLSLGQAFWLWTALNLAALVASLLLLLRGSGLPVWTALALAALVVLYPPVGESLFWGQNKIFVLLMLVLMMRWMAGGHDAAAGLILGIAVLLRGFPLLMVGYLVLRRRWRAIVYTVISIVVGALLTFAILGVSHTLSFSNGFRLVTKLRFLASPTNVSLGAFVSRMYWYSLGAHSGISNSIRLVLVAVAQIGLLAVTAGATVKWRDTVDLDWRAFSLWVVTSVMLSPTAWLHYLVLILIPLIQMAVAASRGRINNRANWMAVASFLLVALSTRGRAAFGPLPYGALPLAVAECSFPCLAMIYVSAYWFAADEVPNVPRMAEIEG
jgi:Glycosyltransferase family 87